MPLPERALIEIIRRLARGGSRSAAALAVGIGDDCAVLRPPSNHELIVTTDFSLEGVHFRREWHPAEAVGHRCLLRGLSDIAAMGGTPLATFLSLALPADLPQSWVEGFLRGFTRLARRFKTPLAGGDSSQSPAGVVADVVVLGSTRRRHAILRSGARASRYCTSCKRKTSWSVHVVELHPGAVRKALRAVTRAAWRTGR